MVVRLAPDSAHARLASVTVALVILLHFIAMATVHAEADASRLLGVQRCVDCHEWPAEAWWRSAHARRSLKTLTTNPLAERYLRRLGIPREAQHSSVCIDCHGTRQQTEDGRTYVACGVSCESCHGAAGSSTASVGWIDLHHDDADPQLSYRQRAAACREAGMAGVEHIYELATKCYTCHNVSVERVVQAGHPAGGFDFELTSWFYGEVRHNFAPYTIDTADCERNHGASNVWLARRASRNVSARRRLMYVVGQLADLEVSLRNRGNATASGTFATAAAGRVAAARARLDTIAQSVSCSQLSDVLAATYAVQPLLFLPPEEHHRRVLQHTADQVAQAAKDFVAEHDGTQLKGLDILLPQNAKGRAYQP